MQKYLYIFVFSMISVTLVGCKEVMDNLTALSESTPEKDDAYRNKITADLKHFDRIKTTNNSVFFDLEEKLKLASQKNTSSLNLRQELHSMASTLRSQNDQFKVQYFSTSEVAKLRNQLMQLNYATIQLISITDNPNEVAKRLNTYLAQQKNLINAYNKLRTEIESSI